MKTGIIMEINERFLTLLTPEGEFLRARKQNRAYAIGQEIVFFPIELKNGMLSRLLPILSLSRGKGIMAAVFAIMLAIVSFLPLLQKDEVYAYMSIDVNPSIELGVNQEYQVVKLVPYNEEGKRIIQNIKDWKKNSIHEVADKILLQIKEQGYFKENKEVVIAAVYTDQNNKADERIQKELADIKLAAQKEQLEVTLLEASKEERDEAIDKGLSPGLYKENKIKADGVNKKISEPVNQNKQADKPSNSPKKSAKTQQSQIKKEELSVEKEKEKKPAVPGQSKKSENQHNNKVKKNSGKNSQMNENGSHNQNKHEYRQNNIDKKHQKDYRGKAQNNQNQFRRTAPDNEKRGKPDRNHKDDKKQWNKSGGNGPEGKHQERDQRNNHGGNKQGKHQERGKR
ncbi:MULTISPECIES: anti-sigma-I factor RsgI family protein [unclassified Cytobacillus]|uniref:anti-sigma-I factor RsgI family protein n=1 Tax=unclassified Cytobacillus TaxID=2675268 RepID=UPI00203D7A39|nr:anti-sigma factor domain-containing protein [Cytobacillus sp. AMY 15.2]MCM3090272.1 anti-sigma factor domain-containing protein [Cytobacillus sp. AMY 15.2]